MVSYLRPPGRGPNTGVVDTTVITIRFFTPESSRTESDRFHGRGSPGSVCSAVIGDFAHSLDAPGEAAQAWGQPGAHGAREYPRMPTRAATARREVTSAGHTGLPVPLPAPSCARAHGSRSPLPLPVCALVAGASPGSVKTAGTRGPRLHSALSCARTCGACRGRGSRPRSHRPALRHACLGLPAATCLSPPTPLLCPSHLYLGGLSSSGMREKAPTIDLVRIGGRQEWRRHFYCWGREHSRGHLRVSSLTSAD